MKYSRLYATGNCFYYAALLLKAKLSTNEEIPGVERTSFLSI
jgi:hypothetical protein